MTGNSDTADYKDTILTTAPPITNCASTTVTTPKVVTDSRRTRHHGQRAGWRSVDRDRGPRQSPTRLWSTSKVARLLRPVPSRSSSARWTRPGSARRVGRRVGSTNLSGASYPVTVQSPTAYVTSAGRYCWRATFSGDSGERHPGFESDSTRQRVLHRSTRSTRRCRRRPVPTCSSASRDGLGDTGRDGDPAGQPGDQPDRYWRCGSGWNDHLQAVRPE